MSNAVNHPPHYGGADSPYEAIKVINYWTRGLYGLNAFCVGNVIKYISRAGKKPGEAPLEPIQKAAWYLRHLVEHAGPHGIEPTNDRGLALMPEDVVVAWAIEPTLAPALFLIYHRQFHAALVLLDAYLEKNR